MNIMSICSICGSEATEYCKECSNVFYCSSCVNRDLTHPKFCKTIKEFLLKHDFSRTKTWSDLNEFAFNGLIWKCFFTSDKTENHCNATTFQPGKLIKFNQSLIIGSLLTYEQFFGNPFISKYFYDRYTQDTEDSQVYKMMNEEEKFMLKLCQSLPETIGFILDTVLPNYYPIDNILIKEQKSVNIHLLAIEKESNYMIMLRELIYQYQNLSFEFHVFCPTLIPEMNSEILDLKKDRIKVQFHAQFYHESDIALMTNLIIGLNVGILAYSTWKETIKLLRSCNIPVVFSELCPQSALESLDQLSIQGLSEDNLIYNPFHFKIAHRNRCFNWLWLENSIIFLPFNIDSRLH